MRGEWVEVRFIVQHADGQETEVTAYTPQQAAAKAQAYRNVAAVSYRRAA